MILDCCEYLIACLLRTTKHGVTMYYENTLEICIHISHAYQICTCIAIISKKKKQWDKIYCQIIYTIIVIFYWLYKINRSNLNKNLKFPNFRKYDTSPILAKNTTRYESLF